MSYKIAVYLRLSRVDEDLNHLEKAESNSISNQRSLIRHYLNTNTEFTLGKYCDYELFEYIDDGLSGTTTEHRPAFLRMIADARAHHIDCIIVKDFSRFSREALVLGDYVEQIFPMIDIRFISVNDHYDSDKSVLSGSASSLAVSMKSLVNEYYVKDLTKKRTAALKTRLQNGLIIGPVPFGYIRNDFNQFEPDEEAAQTVRHIFSLALEGNTPIQIVRILTRENYLSPIAYYKEHPDDNHLDISTFPYECCWSVDTVLNILKNPLYIGTQVSMKSKYSSTNRKKRILTPENERLYFENMHPPLISKQEFELVQKLLAKPHTPKNKRTFPPHHTVLRGHLRCGKCGRSLWISPEGKRCHCSISTMHMEHLCPDTLYYTAPIETFLLSVIKTLSEEIIRTEYAEQQHYRQNRQQILDLRSRQSRLENELQKLTEQKQQLYERFALQTCTLAEYQMSNKALANKVNATQQSLNELKQTVQSLQEFHVPLDLTMLAEKAILYSCYPAVSEEMIDEFIKTVYVLKEAPLRIEWNHAGLLDTYGLVPQITEAPCP